MKRLFLPLLVLVLASCSDHIQEDLASQTPETAIQKATGEHFVSYSDVAALTNAEGTSTRASSNVATEIKCITGNKTNDTLLYVCQKQEGGWTVYSSDTRVPAIVAQSDEGSFDDLMKIDGAKLWIQSMADDMAMIRQLGDEKLNFTREEIENNKAFWESISSPDEFVKKMLKESATRGGGVLDPDAPLDSLFLNGHYEYSFTDSYTEVYDSISRLTHTDWIQRGPYNNYCPFNSDSTYRVPAGCLIIAAAQMLYFLHNKFGVPETAPSTASCNGTINNYLDDWYQNNYTTTVWDSMSTYGYKAAPLVANVANRLHAHFTNNSTSAPTSLLKDSVFAPYNISCTYTSYDSDKVELLRTSLINGIPVLFDAYTTSDEGHAFIADRYKRTRTVTRRHYEWVYDNLTPPFTPLPVVPEYIEYSYSSPVINMIGMNWGWGSYFNVDSEWLSLTGDWFSVRPEASGYHWNVNRHMIYGFSVIN